MHDCSISPLQRHFADFTASDREGHWADSGRTPQTEVKKMTFDLDVDIPGWRQTGILPIDDAKSGDAETSAKEWAHTSDARKALLTTARIRQCSTLE